MQKTSNRIIMVELCLSDIGHTGVCATSVARTAISKGMRAEIWCQADYSGEQTHIIHSILPKFEASPLFWLKSALMLRRKLQNLDEKDLVLFYTMSTSTLLVVWLAIIFSSVKAKIVLGRHFDLSKVMPRQAGLTGAVLNWFVRPFMIGPALWMVSRMPNVFFVSNNGAVLQQLKQKSPHRSFLLPVPHMPSGKISLINKRRIIGYFGDSSRLDKGFHLLSNVIKSIAASDSGIKFIIHAVFSSPHPDQLLLDANSQLQDLSKKLKGRLLIVKKDLSRAEYVRLLGKCDIVLLPYSKDFYSKSVSGVLCEAISLGKWAVVPSGTWLSDQKKNYTRIVEFREQEPESIVNAIHKCLESEDAPSNILKKEIVEWRLHYSEKNFLRILLKNTGRLNK